MKIAILLHSHITPWAKAMKSGLEAHGLSVEISEKSIGCDLAIIHGLRRFSHFAKWQRARKRDFLVVERPYLGGKGFMSLGFNGLNGRADFQNKQSPPDRWEAKFAYHLKPWRPSGRYVLVTGQIATDKALGPFAPQLDYQWLVDDIRSMTDLPIVYRGHPKESKWKAPHPIGARRKKGTLSMALKDAFCTVTISSTTSVDSVLAGTPCIVLDKGSMAWPVCGKSVMDLLQPPRPDRTQWAYDMAYTQWSLREIASGEAWEHLKKKYS